MKKLKFLYFFLIVLISAGILSKNEYLFSRETLADHLSYPLGWETVKILNVELKTSNSRLESQTDFRSAVLMWETNKKNTHANSSKNSEIVIDNGSVFASFDDGTIAAYRITDGKLNWSFQAYLLDTELFFAKIGQFLVVAAKDGRIFALDADTGKMIWFSRTNFNIISLIQASDNKLVLTEKSKIGNVESFYALDVNSGSLNRIDSFIKDKKTEQQVFNKKLDLSKEQQILKQPVIQYPYLAVMLRLGGLRLYKLTN